MKQATNMLLMTILMMFLIFSQRVHCPDNSQSNSTNIELKGGELLPFKDDPYYVFRHADFFVSLREDQKKHTVYLITPLDVEISDVKMRLYPNQEEIPTDVTIFLGSETIVETEGDFNAFDFGREMCGDKECRVKITESMNRYLEANVKKGEHVIRVPLVFTSQTEGTIRVNDLTVEYRISAVEGLKSIPNPETGNLEYIFWEPGAGSNPKYTLEIYSHLPKEPLIEKTVTSPLYKLPDLSPETYHWCVKVSYTGIGESRYTDMDESSKFIIKPYLIGDIGFSHLTDGKEFEFKWKDSENVKHYEIKLNDHWLEMAIERSDLEVSEQNEISYRIKETSEYLCLCGKNTLTIWAVSDSETKSEPRSISFLFRIAPDELGPNSGNPAEKETFSFEWGEVPGAEKYEIRLFKPDNTPIKLPYKEGNTSKKENTAIVDGFSYNPWDEDKYGKDFIVEELKPGWIYTWKVRAVRGSERSDETIQTFVYQPVLLEMLILFSAIGGFLGGFIRIAKEEKSRTTVRAVKIYKDYQTYVDFLVGIIIGVIFYLLIYQTLNQELNPLNIPPSSYAGSVIIGFLGGLTSYDLTRLKRVALSQ